MHAGNRRTARAHAPGGLDAALEFLKRTRNELRTLRWVRVWNDHLHIIDVNHDYFEVRGLGEVFDAPIDVILGTHDIPVNK